MTRSQLAFDFVVRDTKAPDRVDPSPFEPPPRTRRARRCRSGGVIGQVIDGIQDQLLLRHAVIVPLLKTRCNVNLADLWGAGQFKQPDAMVVTLNEVKGLTRMRARFFASLRMTPHEDTF